MEALILGVEVHGLHCIDEALGGRSRDGSPSAHLRRRGRDRELRARGRDSAHDRGRREKHRGSQSALHGASRSGVGRQGSKRRRRRLLSEGPAPGREGLLGRRSDALVVWRARPLGVVLVPLGSDRRVIALLPARATPHRAGRAKRGTAAGAADAAAGAAAGAAARPDTRGAVAGREGGLIHRSAIHSPSQPVTSQCDCRLSPSGWQINDNQKGRCREEKTAKGKKAQKGGRRRKLCNWSQCFPQSFTSGVCECVLGKCSLQDAMNTTSREGSKSAVTDLRWIATVASCCDGGWGSDRTGLRDQG